MENKSIRKKVFDSELTYRKIAKAMNCRAEYLSRLLSKPLSEKNRKKVLDAIELAKKNNV